MSNIATYDVIVVGGGPAGMMAAGRASERGLRVLLIEKNDVFGKKLSITGGGRCNITNAEFDVRTLLKKYGPMEQFLYAPFAQFGVQETFDFFTSKSLPLVIEESKRAFPQTEKATDVTRVMERYIKDNNVVTLMNTPVKGFSVSNGEIQGIVTEDTTYTARAYIIASGGKSHPETGSTGEGISWLREIGHLVHEPNPDLVPLIAEDAWVKNLSGRTFTDVRITFVQGSNKIKKEGNVLCTHFGLSGPLIINSAREVKKMLLDGPVTAHIDLFPKDDVGTLRGRLQVLLDTHSNKTFSNALSEWFPKEVVEAILECFSDEIKNTKAHSVAREVRHAFVDRIKNLTATITGALGYERAIVSDGGVDLKEVDTRTMESKLHKHLYIVGDVLNIKRASGGYSLQLCWTTGWVAGNNVLSEKE